MSGGSLAVSAWRNLRPAGPAGGLQSEHCQTNHVKTHEQGNCMNASSSRDDSAVCQDSRVGAKHKFGRKSAAGSIAVLALVAIYSYAAPQLNSRFGLNLPQLETDADRQTAPNSTTAAKSTAANSTTANSVAADSELLYGILREVSRDRYLSPQGLQYTPGSAEGHRLEHLRRHTKDDPGRPGRHGVFDGDMQGALKTIDRAYERAKKGQQTTKSTDDGRTIYTVDMGSRVGFVGGAEGSRKRNPMARRVRLVLDGTYVITAYPM